MTSELVSIPRVLDAAVQYGPDHQAIVARAGTLTYREFDRRIDVAAGGLWELGVRPGDRIAASLPNDLDIVVAFHAAMRLGAVWVGIAETLAAPEKNRLLHHCNPRIYLCSPEWSTDLEISKSGPIVLEAGLKGGADSWAQLLAAGHRAPPVDVDPHAPAGIAYTSGTTGTPKGIVHSQHNLLMPGLVLTTTRGYNPSLRKGDCLPLTTLNLMVLSTLLTAQARGCCIVMDRRDPEGIVRWIGDQSVTVWNGVPTQLQDLVRRNDIQRAHLSSLNEVWCGGAGLDDQLRSAFDAKFGLNPRATYGLTEVPTIVAIDPPGTHWRPRSSGITLPHLTVGVEHGEVVVSAATSGRWAGQYTPMLGYWNGECLTPSGEFIETGDLGLVDDDGWIHIIDRRKLVIVRGGANVYPTEVETVLRSFPGVADVAVFGVPDERLGQRVAALLEPRSRDGPVNASLLRAYCMARLAAYKIPDVWATVDALPRNAMGKVVRTQLLSVLDLATSGGDPLEG